MDSEHRHELKENELAEFFRHFGQFWQKWGNSLLLVVLVVLVAVVAVQMITGYRYREQEKNWQNLEFERSPAGLASVAESVDDPAVRALAHLRAGDRLLRRQAEVGAAADLSAGVLDDAAARQRELQEAATHYETVRDMADLAPVYKVNALLGLAAAAEGQRQWELADQRYEQAISEAEAIDQPALAEQAKQRLAELERLQEPMTLAPPVAPTETDASSDDAGQ